MRANGTPPAMTALHCRHCGASLQQPVIDLGHQPPSNAYLSADQLKQAELTYPLKVYVCTSCWLVQLPCHAAAETLFSANYAYLSSISTSWCAHAERYVATATERLNLSSDSMVVELASNDGYLLKYVLERGIPCLGIEPTHSTAQLAVEQGIPTLEQFFSQRLAEELVGAGGAVAGGADLVVANNVLAHVPDINDFLAGISRLLKPTGQVSIEFPHLLQLLQGNQFDTIYHEHYSYLSLAVLHRIGASVGLVVVDLEELPTHGGSLRVWLTRSDAVAAGKVVPDTEGTARLAAGLAAEKAAGLETPEAYRDFQSRAEAAKHSLLRFLLQARKQGQKVCGYGAAAKGNTLLNYAGVKPDLLDCVADKAASKIGKFLPASHIPVVSPEGLAAQRPDGLLVLPWNIAAEVQQQWRQAGYGDQPFYRAIPSLELLG
ncbi:MAG: class I SAM-dependent methyltransferase [Synechococcus sp.]|nr:class I SAM-dependent methyltransferase [Synechococcus sp.]